MSQEIPSHAQCVIIGGGSIGCNIAYHLTKLGMTDVVVLERDKLTSGTTWHAAGEIVPAVLGAEWECELYTYGRNLIAGLEAETGQATGFRQVGYIQPADTTERLEELRRGAAFMSRFGIEMHEITATEAAERFPIGDFSDTIAAFWYPLEGRTNPVDTTQALARGARSRGARIVEDTSVQDILTANGRVTGVRTDKGDIMAEHVVIAAGMWSRQIGARAGLNLPLQAAEHYYLITEPIEGVTRDLPLLEDAHSWAYFREEVGGLLVGLFEPDAAPWNIDAIPENFIFGEIEPDWDRVVPHLEAAFRRVPSAATAGVKKLFCGPESFTPDLAPLVGEAPGLRNCWVAAGLNSLGILYGPGIGMALAHWIVDGRCPVDHTAFNVDRFADGSHNTPAFRHDRTKELLAKSFGAHFPNDTFKTARGLKRSALYDRLKDAGAYFTESHGWEQPDWFAPSNAEAKIEAYSWGRQNWWDWHAEEHRAAREDVILMDMSSMAKFLVQGRDACALLNRISCNEVDVPNGRVVYTAWTNDAGGFEADLTVTRLGREKFLVVVGENSHGHTKTWMRRHIGPDQFVTITDVTPGITQINVHGPRARDLMERVSETDLSDDAFPFMTAQEIDVGYFRVTALRVTYVGELGWELHVPNLHAVQVYDLLKEAGADLGVRDAGMQTLSSLRLEKAYRDFGVDVDNTDNPIEAGLGFAVKLDKPGGFIGRDSLARLKAEGTPKRRMLQFLLTDPAPLLFSNETVYLNGTAVGHIQVGAYGHTLGGAVGIGFAETAGPLTPDDVASGTWEIDVAGTRFPAKASLKPLFDPGMERIRS
ncbi:FAD-dependent oxidoreductase [Alphaproteobacteria bacterium GH1-50]|uniref:FAD-dependent oxidoreductase n=1 Tax=Kangsaoukella pontilimi TaxID=2691042 RepID=A0A7C9IH83_9RHOB|nr:FAD-dependent oxidoreductase [Kangsaoukella pontilimi]MXQ07482.1 FAD-dependent oxidoreductase [Kangsaoukella pontilimi]